MPTINRQYLVDLGERVAATAAEAGLALAITELASIPGWWVLPLTTALAAAKGWIAKHVGSARTASLAKTVK